MSNQPINKYSTGQLHRYGMEIRGKIKTADDGSEFLHIYQRKKDPGFFSKVRYAIEDAFGRSKPLTGLLKEESRFSASLLTHVKQFVINDGSESAGQIDKINLPFSRQNNYVQTKPIKIRTDEMIVDNSIATKTDYSNAKLDIILKKINTLQKENRKPYLRDDEMKIFEACLNALEASDREIIKNQSATFYNQAEIELELIASLRAEINSHNDKTNEPLANDLKTELSHHIKDKHPFDLITRHQLNAANNLLYRLITQGLGHPLTDNEQTSLKKLQSFVIANQITTTNKNPGTDSNKNQNPIPEIIADEVLEKIKTALRTNIPTAASISVLSDTESLLNPDIPGDQSIPETVGTRTMQSQQPTVMPKNRNDAGTDLKTSGTQTPEKKVEIPKQDYSPTGQNSADLSEFNKRFITMRVTSRIDQLIQPISELTTEQKRQVNHYLRNPEKIPRYIDPTLDLEARELLKAIGSRRRELNTFFDDAESAFANTVFDEKLRNILDDLELKQPAQSTHNQKPLSGS